MSYALIENSSGLNLVAMPRSVRECSPWISDSELHVLPNSV